MGDIVGQDGWAAVHHAVYLGNTEVLEVILKHPGFVKVMKPFEGKATEVVAMEAENWCGTVKELSRRYNLVT